MNSPESFPDSSDQIDSRNALMQAWGQLSDRKDLDRLTLDDINIHDGYGNVPIAEHGSKAYEFVVPLPDLDVELVEEDTYAGLAFWSEHGNQQSRFFSSLGSIPMFTLSYTPFIESDYAESVKDGITYRRTAVFIHTMQDGEQKSQAYLMAFDEDDNHDDMNTIEPYTQPKTLSLAEKLSFKTIVNQINLGAISNANRYPDDGQINLWWPGGEDYWVPEKDLQD